MVWRQEISEIEIITQTKIIRFSNTLKFFDTLKIKKIIITVRVTTRSYLQNYLNILH